MKEKLYKLSPVALPLLAIILEILPLGAVLWFDGGEAAFTAKRTYSYFSLTPYGYANFGPFLTACLSCLLLLLGVLCSWRGRCKNALFPVSLLATITSLLPLFLGVNYLSAVGICISLLLLANTLVTAKMRIKA